MRIFCISEYGKLAGKIMRSPNFDNPLSTNLVDAAVAATPIATDLNTSLLQRSSDTTGINRPPVNIVPGSQNINEDGTLVFINNQGTAIRVSDNDGGNNPLVVNLTAANGIVKIVNGVGVTVDNNNTANVTLTGSLDRINNALNGLQFQSDRDFFGNAQLTVRSDDQSSSDNVDEDSIFITVNPVNDMPVFLAGGSIKVDENQIIEPTVWAREISAGAENESEQVLSFIVSNNNPSLFTQLGQPQISAEGILSYELASNANGVAEVRVQLQDDGIVNNLSSPKTFTISVTPRNNPPSNILPNVSLTVDEDSPLALKGENAIAIQDPDAGTNAIEVKLENPDGKLQVVGNNAVKVQGNNSNQLTLVGDVGNINQVLGSLIFQPNPNFYGDTILKITTNDRGATGGNLPQIDESQLTITVNPVNDAPTFVKGNDENINEDTAARVIENWATQISPGAANESNQTLRFIVNNDNNSLFAVQPQISRDGTLTYEVAENANGTAQVQVILDDGQTEFNTSTPQSFTINVNAINDAPDFDLASTEGIVINEDSPSQTITDFITNITPGAANEINQDLTFTLVNDNPQLFSQAPTISSDGTLTFTPANNAFGIANISLKLEDSGGTENQGENTSTSKIFNITINPVNDAPQFTPGENITVNAGSGVQTISNWTTEFNLGPANEANQEILEYVITDISNPDIFTNSPSISPNGTLTFTPVNSLNELTTATISVRLKDNGGTSNGGIDASAIQTFEITVNPLLMNVTSPVTEVVEGNEGTTEYKFNFSLSNPSTESITVDYAVIEETATLSDDDYSIANPTSKLEFAPGQTQKELTILVNGDRKFEADQTFRIDWNNSLGQNGSQIGTIVNDDTRPIVAITGVKQREGDTGNQPYEFTVSLDRASDELIRVEYQILDGTATTADGDYTATNQQGVLEFTPGLTSQKIIVDVNGDRKFESLESFSIVLSNPVNTSLASGRTTALGIIQDDEGDDSRDMNADGNPDIVWRNSNTGENAIWLMNQFQLENPQLIESISDSNWQIEQVADLNDDGKLDLFWRNHATGDNAIWTMDGNRILSQEFTTSADPTWKLAAIADLNGDGGMELIWRNYATGENAIWSMDGARLENAVFIEPITDINWHIQEVGDFDGNGKADLLWRNYATGENAIWFMDGTQLANAQFIRTEANLNWQIAGVADMNNDGKFDIVWRNYTSGENRIWSMDGNQVSQETNLLREANTAWRIVGLQDFSGDGKIDILWRNYESGENGVWEMNGTNLVRGVFLDKVDPQWQIV